MSPSNLPPARLTVYRESLSTEQKQVAKKLCRDVAAIDGALNLERWTSSLLGRVWERRHMVTEECETEVAMLAVGERLLESFATRGGSAARTALTAVAQIDRGALGLVAGEMATALAHAPIPDWVAQVGTARIVKAFATPGSGLEEALLLVPDHTAEPHMVAVFITERGIAKHLSLTTLFDPNDPPVPAGEPELPIARRFRPVVPNLACLRVRAAIERSNDALSRELGPEFADNRALAIARLACAEPPLSMRVGAVRRLVP
jgi:hypothetical protein